MKMRSLPIRAISLGVATLITSPARADTAELIFVDDLIGPLVPGTVTHITVKGVSSFGSTITGELITNDGTTFKNEAYRWSESDGLVMLGSLNSEQHSSAVAAVSGDGMVIVGDGTSNDGKGSPEPYRWNTSDGIIGLGYLPGRVSGGGFATATNPDGSIIVGGTNSGNNAGGWETEAFRWTEAAGMVGLGDLSGGPFLSLAHDLSADGSVIVGSSQTGEETTEAFYWTEATGMVSLGLFAPGHDQSVAEIISADGKVVAGYSDEYDSDVRIAFRWTEADGMVALSEDATLQPEPRGTIEDGSVIVGLVWIPAEGRTYGFIWDEGNGLQDIEDVLTQDFGLPPFPAGTSIAGINGISDEGTALWGFTRDSAPRDRDFIIRIIHDLPEITTSPVGQSVNSNEEIVLSVDAEGDHLQYQWQIDGVDYPGATESTFIAPSAQHFHNGDFTVVVSNTGGSVTSAVAAVTVAPSVSSDSRLLNLSTRALSQTGGNVLIPGFVLSGSGTKRLMIRAVGPTLADFGVGGALDDPELVLNQWDTGSSTYVEVGANDDWGDAANADLNGPTSVQVGAFPLSEGSADSSIITDLVPGQYSAVAGGKDDGTGVAIVELYDADVGASTTTLQNISNRGFVGTEADIMIPGFTISQEGTKTLLIRAVGPALADFGVPGVLDDPQLTVFRRNPDTQTDEPILYSDNWDEMPGAATTASAATMVGAFPLGAGSKDAAFVVTLPPGVYTVHASGVDGITGTALVEVYVVE